MPQNRPKLQHINMPQYRNMVSVRSHTIDAGFTGSTNDTVLLWSGGANQTIVSNTAADVTVTNSATDGTSVLITTPGIYVASLLLTVNVTGTPTIVAGINLTGNGLTADPSLTTCAALGRVLVVTADDAATISLSTTFNVVSPGQTIPVRFQASNGAGAVPAANSLVLVNASYQIFRIDIAD
jgi:hypothetical protein